MAMLVYQRGVNMCKLHFSVTSEICIFWIIMVIQRKQSHINSSKDKFRFIVQPTRQLSPRATPPLRRCSLRALAPPHVIGLARYHWAGQLWRVYSCKENKR
jgi:hypothetical protein